MCWNGGGAREAMEDCGGAAPQAASRLLPVDAEVGRTVEWVAWAEPPWYESAPDAIACGARLAPS